MQKYSIPRPLSFLAPAWLTWLFYNPHPTTKTFQSDVGSKSVDLYDAVTHQFIKRNARGTVSLTLAPDTAAVIVATPAGGKLTRDGKRTLVDGVVVDYADPATNRQ